MKRIFVEVKEFQHQIDNFNDAELLRSLQESILKDPEAGVLIKGSSGIRKVRMIAKGKGKSGGIRVFYLDIPLKEKCYLLFILEKSNSANITDKEKNELKKLSQILKR